MTMTSHEPQTDRPKGMARNVRRILWLTSVSVVGVVTLAIWVSALILAISADDVAFARYHDVTERVTQLERQADAAALPSERICADGYGNFRVYGVNQFQVRGHDGDTWGPFNIVHNSARYWPTYSGFYDVRGRNLLPHGGWTPWSEWQHCAAELRR